MASPPQSPRLVKPVIPPLMTVSFTRLAKPISPLLQFASSPCPFRPDHLPQLPLLHDHVLAAIITFEPQPQDDFGTDVQTWGDEKHTLLSLAERGFKFFESKVTERVQDLAPGPFKDREGIKVSVPKALCSKLIEGNDNYDGNGRNTRLVGMLLRHSPST